MSRNSTGVGFATTKFSGFCNICRAQVKVYTNNGNANSNITTDDEYYLATGTEPIRFVYYRIWRIAHCPDKWKRITCMASLDSITQDELDFSLKAQLRVPPEERYQRRKKHWYFHEWSYLHQTKDSEGNYHDVVKEYGCGRSNNACVPECRYYAKEGRIEDEEVIREHNDSVEYYRQRNAIIDIKLPSYDKMLKDIELGLTEDYGDMP